MQELEATVQTKLGELFIRSNGRDCITLMMSPVVRGIKYQVLQYADKKNIKDQWLLNSQYSSIKRGDTGGRINGNMVSTPTRNLITNTCQVALDTWLLTHADACEESQVAHLTREAQQQHDEVEWLRARLKEAEQLLASQMKELLKLSGMGVTRLDSR